MKEFLIFLNLTAVEIQATKGKYSFGKPVMVNDFLKPSEQTLLCKVVARTKEKAIRIASQELELDAFLLQASEIVDMHV